MQFGNAFKFQFEDTEWFKKIVIAALASIIPFVGIGWGLEITRRVINDDPEPLPKVEVGSMFVKGLQAFIIALVYSIPLIILGLPHLLWIATEESETMVYIAGAVSACCGGLDILYMILMWFLIPAAYGRFSEEGSIGSALKFKEIFKLVRAYPVGFLFVLLGGLVGSIIAPLGSVICGIGALLTQTYSNSLVFHLMGQAYKEAKLAQS